MRDDTAIQRYKRMMEATPVINRQKTPPGCRNCMYFQPRFRYRSCLFASCPYGKKGSAIFRRKPLRKEKITAERRRMHV